MKIASVNANGRRRAFEVKTARQTFVFPFARAVPAPSASDPVVSVYPDPEMGRTGFTYQLRSGLEGSVHIDSVLEVAEDPKFMADLVMYRLSLEAQRRMEESGENVRDVAHSLRTSPTQLYRLLDQTNYTKSFRQLVSLLNYLGCDVDVRITPTVRKRGRSSAGISDMSSTRHPGTRAQSIASK